MASEFAARGLKSKRPVLIYLLVLLINLIYFLSSREFNFYTERFNPLTPRSP